MAQIDNLTLEITSDSTKAVQALNNLSNALNSFKTNMPTKAKFDNMTQGFKGLREEISKLSVSSRSLEKIKAIGTIARNISKLNSVKPRVIESTATGINSLSASLDNISYESIIKIERLSKALSQIPQNAPIKSVTRGVSKVQAATTTTPQTSGVTTADTSEIEKVGSQAQKTVGFLQTLGNLAKSIKSPLSGIRSTLTSVGTAFKAVTKPIQNFVKALARIAFYRFIRGILKTITQGIQQGIQNLALYSKAMEELDAHSANNVMSRYASSFMYFKNAVATAIMPLLRGLVPVIETVINRLIDLINVLAQVGSAFFGGTFTKAKYVWIDYADSLDKASGSAKKLHHQLAGFDELNNLTAPSAGGRGAEVPDPSQMFEESQIDGKIQEFVNKLKGMWEKVQSMTKPYTDKLKKMWDDISKKVLPDLKEIYNNLKEIWDELLAPIIDEFIKGWLDGFYDDVEGLPDKIDDVTESLKDWTNKLVDLKDKLPTEDLKKLATTRGFLTGKVNPLLTLTNLMPASFWSWRETGWQLGTALAEKLNPAVEDLKSKLGILKTKLEDAYNATLNLQNPTSWLSEKLATLALKAISVYSQFQTVIDKVTSLQTHFDVLKNWFTVFNPFKSVQERADALHTALENIRAGLELIKRITQIVITISLKVTGQDAVKNALEQLGDAGKKIANEIDNKIKGEEANQKDNGGQERAQVDNKNKNPQRPTSPSSGNAPSGYSDITSYINDMKKKANGGFVSRGDLFIANEKMPEFVGSIGGNTAVANNDQITEAIAQATYTAMSKALAENGGSVNIVVEGDGDKMFKVFQKKQTEYNRRTGFAY